ncbi:hypothetical protein H327_18780 [Vibrio parahaemolyticus 3324]|nr:hypothetical protein AJ90_26540 [Vibrio parahaemolyticus M0605]KIS87320.1 hypothetical protein H338_18710 [Vibrio parahaemolyticus EN9701173]KIS89361.1 hypothetical protein H333_18760 [Vibrio parahaemolyticus 12315]KIS95538.1 hypothetical protein H324_18720 [Vibrio parahaemolyticus 846]KIS99081.1 hypothetical protein H327_18780 [Vibrio parahaemolyticus 3324]KIT19806.1 hypothetical protein H335_18710 [Vibrio parahaemolyticus EN2910]KIT46299.1 hypothetical protein H337_07710 [Vibrio parahaem
MRPRLIYKRLKLSTFQSSTSLLLYHKRKKADSEKPSAFGIRIAFD